MYIVWLILLAVVVLWARYYYRYGYKERKAERAGREAKRTVSEPGIDSSASWAEENAANPARIHLDPMKEWHGLARRTLAAVALFSIFVNLLMLTMPLYLFQLSDRVLTSHSLDTLLMLTILALVFIGVLSLLDILRRQVLGRLATRFETILGGPVLASVVTTAKVADGANTQALPAPCFSFTLI